MMDGTAVVRDIGLVEREEGVLRRGINDVLGAVNDGKGECAQDDKGNDCEDACRTRS